MYGAFGKNINHVNMRKIKSNLLICLLIINIMLTNHGINAKNRFQFRDKNLVVSVAAYLTIDMLKQNIDDKIKNIEMFKLPFFFNSSIILIPF